MQRGSINTPIIFLIEVQGLKAENLGDKTKEPMLLFSVRGADFQHRFCQERGANMIWGLRAGEKRASRFPYGGPLIFRGALFLGHVDWEGKER